MTNLAQRVRARVAESADQQIEFLTRLVSLETPTEDRVRTRQGLELLASELEVLGFRCKFFSGKCSGGQLIAVPRVRKSGRCQRPRISLVRAMTAAIWASGNGR